MRIVNPYFLILIPIAVAGLLLLARRAAAYRARLHFFIRLLIVTAVAITAAGFQMRRPDSGIDRFILVDVSNSTGFDTPLLEPHLKRLAGEMTRYDRLAVIEFGRNPSAAFGPADTSQFALSETGGIDRDATDIEDALALVRSMRRPGATAQVVLVTDANETTGSVRREIIRYAADGIPVHVIPVQRTESDFAVRLVDAPQAVRSGSYCNIVAEVTGNGQITLTAGTDEGFATQETLFVDGSVLWRASLPLENPGLREIEISLHSDNDAFPANNRCTAPVWVHGPVSILWVTPEESSLADAAERSGLSVAKITPSKLPSQPGDLLPYDLIVIENAPAWQLPEGAAEAVETYVRRMGGGLVMLGEAAFGPGGYAGTPIETVLPVECDPEEKQSEPVALAVAIDRSGSMNERVEGRRKLSYAQEGIAQILRQLKANDQLAVIAFDTAAETVIPLQPATDTETIRRRVFAMQAWGGTDVNAGLQAVYRQLQSAPENARCHAIFLTDGLSDTHVDAERWAGVFSEAGMTVSAAGIGEEIDEQTLRSLSQGTGGTFYHVREIQSLPDILAAEARPSDSEFVRYDPEGFPVRLLDTVLTSGIGEPPAAQAYVLVKPKDTAETSIEVAEGYTLLATRRYGAGRSTAFAAPAGTFGDWEDAATLWAQIIEHTARPAGDADVAISVTTSNNEARVELAAGGGTPRAYHANVVTPAGDDFDVDFSQIAPDLFAAGFDMNETGVYSISIMEGISGNGRMVSRAAAALPYSPEWERLRANRELLDEIARATGGTVMNNLAELPAAEAPAHEIFRDLSWLPVLIGLALFLVELALP